MQRRIIGINSNDCTKDGSSKLHRVVNLDNYEGPTRIIIDETSVPTGHETIPRIVDRAKEGSFSFDNDKDIVEWRDEKATIVRVSDPRRPMEKLILSQLCWKIMDREDRVRWTMIFSGDIYILFLIAFVLDEDQRPRPVMYCSDVMKIGDPTFNICTILLYMSLTSPEDISQPEILAKLNIDCPAAPAKLPIPKKLLLRSEEANHLEVLKTVS